MATMKKTSGETKRLALAQTAKSRITLSPRDFSKFSKAFGGVFKPYRATRCVSFRKEISPSGLTNI